MLRRWVTLAVITAALIGVAPAVHAQATRGLTPVPFNSEPPTQLSITLDQKQPVIGTFVTICFQSSKPGYATFWNISTANQVVRIFPNQYSRVGPAAQIEGGKRYCAGTGGDPFRFRVDGPTGTEDLLLVWTTRPELQPSGTDYADAGALASDLQRMGGANTADWGTAKVTYDIVGPNGPEQAAPPAPQVSGSVTPPPAAPPAAPSDTPSGPPSDTPSSGQTQAQPSQPPAPAPSAPQQTSSNEESAKVWVLATGANVGELTKSNQDAAMFTKTVMSLFSVPEENVVFIENGKYADIVQGFKWLVSKAGPNDFVFVFFSGHGGRFKDESSSDGYDEFLVPYDFQDPHADGRNLLTSQRFAAMINQLQTKHVIAVIDACHSAGVYRSVQSEVLGARNKFFRFPADVDQDAVRAQMLAGDDAMIPRTRAAGGRGRIAANGLLLAAAKRDQSALEGSKGSLFTLAIVQEMVSKEGGTLMDVFNRSVTLTEQMSESRQDPEAVGDLELGRSISFSP